jgi:hypothetical protein
MKRRAKHKSPKEQTIQNTAPQPRTDHNAHQSTVLDKSLKTLGRTCGWLWRWTWIGRAIIWLSVAVTLVCGFFVFLPRVTVDVSWPYNASNPSAVTFTINNINIVPLRNVIIAVGLCSLSFNDEPPMFCNGPAATTLAPRLWTVKWLDVDERYEIALESLIKMQDSKRQVTSANITIIVGYAPWLMPWRNKREFRFVTEKLSDGRVYWVPTPLNR